MRLWSSVMVRVFVYGFTCQSRALDIDMPDEISSYLVDYKASNGKPIVEFLESYGITIKSLTVDSVADGKGERSLIITAQTRYRANRKKPPCEIVGWYKRLPEETSEIDKDAKGRYSSDDPIFHWASTGKCVAGWLSP